jgi:hypothetical protein
MPTTTTTTTTTAKIKKAMVAYAIFAGATILIYAFFQIPIVAATATMKPLDKYLAKLRGMPVVYTSTQELSYTYDLSKADKENFEAFTKWWCSDDAGRAYNRSCVAGYGNVTFPPDTFMTFYVQHRNEIIYDNVVQGMGAKPPFVDKDLVKLIIYKGYVAYIQTGSVHVDCSKCYK